MERAVVVANSDTISLEHLLLGVGQKSSAQGHFTSEWQEAKAEFERTFLVHQLREFGGNISEVARGCGDGPQ